MYKDCFSLHLLDLMVLLELNTEHKTAHTRWGSDNSESLQETAFAYIDKLKSMLLEDEKK